MKIEIIAVSKNKFSYIDEAEADYLKRLKQYADVEVLNIKEEPLKGDDEKVKKVEGEKIIAKLKGEYLKIALDLTGEQMSSEEFANVLIRNRDFEGAKMQFIIGGPVGLSGEVIAYADQIISFSKMTFTHQLMRILLLEQLYRGFEIIKGSEYHK